MMTIAIPPRPEGRGILAKKSDEYIDPVDPDGLMIKDFSSDHSRKFKR